MLGRFLSGSLWVDTAIVFAAMVLLGVVVVSRLPMAKTTVAADLADLRVGAPLSPPLANLAIGKRTIIIGIRTTCDASKRGVAFYQTLARTCIATAGCEIVVVSPELEPVLTAWLNAAGVVAPAREIPQYQPTGIHTTPTVAFVDASGTVTDLVVGLPSRSIEAAMLDRVRHGDLVPRITNVTHPDVLHREQVRELMSQRKVVLLDVRERAQCRASDQSALCLPLKELELRAPVEFPDRSLTLAIDCTRLGVDACRSAVSLLADIGFRSVIAVVAP